MTDRITLELNAGEAIVVLDAVDRSAAEAFAAWRRLIATDAPADEQAIPLTRGQILSRVTAQLSSALYPPCEWLEPCEMVPASGSAYCRFHTAQIAARSAAVA